MRQLNVFHMCSAAAASRFSSLAYLFLVDDWWNTFANSRSTPVSPLIKDLLGPGSPRALGIVPPRRAITLP
nr:unnamed protein product [Digitaria exilis]